MLMQPLNTKRMDYFIRKNYSGLLQITNALVSGLKNTSLLAFCLLLATFAEVANSQQSGTNSNLRLVQIDALNNDRAIGIGTDDQVHYWNGSWITLEDTLLTHASFGIDGSVWGVNEAGQVWRSLSVTGRWELIPGE